jgi:multiple sugar transport system permease protein
MTSHRPAGLLARRTLLYLTYVVIGVITIFPFLWMISTSLKRPGDALVIPPQWIPDPVSFESYPRLFTKLPFGVFFANSIKISFLVVAGQLLICSLGGYGFARLNFRGKNAAFAILIGSLMLPAAVRIVPLYLGYKTIGWLDTHWPVILPHIVANTFGTFLFRQFFMTIPDDLEDAAVIDGCNRLSVYWHVMMPQAGPVVSTVAIFAFMHSWNNFLEPLIFLNRIHKFTVPIGLSFFQESYGTEYTVLMAGTTVAVLPILIVYFLGQDYFVKGIVTTGLKG